MAGLASWPVGPVRCESASPCLVAHRLVVAAAQLAHGSGSWSARRLCSAMPRGGSGVQGRGPSGVALRGAARRAASLRAGVGQARVPTIQTGLTSISGLPRDLPGSRGGERPGRRRQ